MAFLFGCVFFFLMNSQGAGQSSLHLYPRNRHHNVSVLIRLLYSECIITHSHPESSMHKAFIKDVNCVMLARSSLPHTMLLSILLPSTPLAFIPTAMSIYLSSFFFISQHLHPTFTCLPFSLLSLWF